MAQNSSNLPGIDNFPIYISYSVGGIIIGASNLVIFLSIARYEALRTSKVYVLIMAQSLADSINMLAFTIGANVMLTVVSLDRLFCVQSPLRYIGYTHRYTMVLAGSAYLYSIGSGAVGLAWIYVNKDEQSRDLVAACITPIVFSKPKLYSLHINLAPMFWAFLSVLIYLVIWVGYIHQNSQIGPEPDNQGQKYQLEHQRKYTQSLGISCICSFCLFIVPWQLGYVFNKLDYHLVAMVMYTASNLNPVANVIIYLKRHEEIRQALKGLVTCKRMPTDVKAWKVNRQAAQNMAPPKSAGGHRYAGEEIDVNVEEL